jgi:hypothetical protein
MPDEVGKDAQTTAALQRRHLTYEHELIALGLQVFYVICLLAFLPRLPWFQMIVCIIDVRILC